MRFVAEGRHAGDRRPVRRLDGPRLRHRGRRRWPSGSRTNRPELKRAYVFRDDSLEYSKATADYFEARWQELGGEICGKDTFVGGANLDLVLADHAPARRGRRLRRDLRRLLAAVRLAADPRDPRRRASTRRSSTNASVNGTLVNQVAGNDVSNFYVARLRLPADVLRRARRRSRSVQIATSSRRSTASRSETTTRCRATRSQTRSSRRSRRPARPTATKIAEALFGGQVKINYFGNPMQFTEKCHRPQPAALLDRAVDRTARTSRSTRVVVEADPRHRRRQPLLRRAAGGRSSGRKRRSSDR